MTCGMLTASATYAFESGSSDVESSILAGHVRRAIVAALTEAGIGLPDPDRRVIQQMEPSQHLSKR